MYLKRIALTLAVGLIGALVPATAHALYQFDPASANITAKTNPDGTPYLSESEIRSDVNTLAGIADIIGFQEMKTFYHHDAVNDLVGWSKFNVDGPGSGNEVPIAWKDSVWTLDTSGLVQIYDGAAAGIPVRYMSWVRLVRVSDGTKVRVLNAHFPAGADWEDSTPEDPEKVARAAWQTAWNNMNAEVDSWMAGGYTPMVLVGDYNRKVGDMPKFASSQVFASPGGIDHVAYIADSHFDTVSDVTYQNGATYNTDHGPKIFRLKRL